MRFKVNIFTLLFSLVFVVAYLSQSALPNQQILLELSDINSSHNTSYNAVEKIKASLQSNGARQITVINLDNGQLKITYFSDVEIYDIQKILSQELGFKFKLGGDLPSQQLPDSRFDNGYFLQISELSPDYSDDWGFESTEIIISQIKADRFTPVKHKHFLLHRVSERLGLVVLKSSWSFNSFLHTKQSSYHVFPEVRAGPTV